MNEPILNYKTYLHDYLDEARYQHTLCVVKWAKRLAKLYDCEQQPCEIAAALHDILKQKDVSFLLQWCQGFAIIQEITAKNAAALLHGPAAAAFVKKTFGLSDQRILDAITYHTTGRANMTKIEKIVFLADMIGEDRTYPGVQNLRKLALKDLDEAVFCALSQGLVHLISKSAYVASGTLDAYNYYTKQR